MKKFFYPESIAVFGVSGSRTNLARIIVENLGRFNFKGHVYPVGTSEGVVAGKKILKNIEEVDNVPDLAVVLVPARYAPETLEACGKKGIKNVILESGGFSELDDDRFFLEKKVCSIAEQYGIRLIGPNCFGIINLEEGVVLPFFIINPLYMKKGSASLISQSGGVFYDTCMLCSIENVGLRKLVSIGNKLMTDENDIFEYMQSDDGAHVIGLYLENFSDGRRFMGLVGASDKPVVVLKANRSTSSGQIARFHTTALAGDDDVAESALRQAGAVRVTNFQEMVDCFKIFSLPILRGKRLALISRSGGHGVLSADAAYRYGFEFAGFSEDFFKAIKDKKLNVIAATNPLDIGDVYDLNEYVPILEMALREEGVDGVVFVVTYSSESDGSKVRDFIRYASEITPGYGKPVALCVVTNREEWFAIKEAADFPVFTDVDQAMRSLSWSYGHFMAKEKKPGVISAMAPLRTFKRAIDTGSGKRLLEPEECFALLSGYGLPIADYEVVHDRGEVVRSAGRLGYPVALKAGSGMLHKSEAMAVFTGIVNAEGLSRALGIMDASSYLVQKMAPEGHEIVIGGRFDREFGPVVVCGLGGIYVEIIADRSIRVAPVDDETAGMMIEELKGSAILKGARGRKPADIGALKDVIVRVSRLLAEQPDIMNIDINPVIVHEEGKGCTIVDAKIERSLT